MILIYDRLSGLRSYYNITNWKKMSYCPWSLLPGHEDDVPLEHRYGILSIDDYDIRIQEVETCDPEDQGVPAIMDHVASMLMGQKTFEGTVVDWFVIDYEMGLESWGTKEEFKTRFEKHMEDVHESK